MGYEFLIEMLKVKKGHLQTALQYVDAGCDNPKTIQVVSKEIKDIDRRIRGLEEMK